MLPEIDDLVHRAIECGALVDPWNILGFGGQFSLFPAIENSIHDHRIDELIDLMEDLFGLYARLQKEAAAGGQAGPAERRFPPACRRSPNGGTSSPAPKSAGWPASRAVRPGSRPTRWPRRWPPGTRPRRRPATSASGASTSSGSSRPRRSRCWSSRFWTTATRWPRWPC